MTGVARASLDELILDYEDYLRQRGLRVWDKDSLEALRVRKKLQESSDLSELSDSSDEVAANTILCLAHQGGYLLSRQ